MARHRRNLHATDVRRPPRRHLRKLTALVSSALLTCGAMYLVAANHRSNPFSRIPHGVVAVINRSAPADDIYASQLCAGTLIAPTVVLTAAHCMADETPEQLDVVVDADNLCRPNRIVGERLHVRGFADAPQESGWSPDAIALILASPSSQPPAQVAPVPQGTDVDAYGWSSKSVVGGHQCHLRRIRLNQLANDACASAITDRRRWSPSEAEILCAVPASSEVANTCHGDSGGPVFARGSLVAMTISGTGCEVDDPGAYLRVASLSTWLETLDTTLPRPEHLGQ